MTSSSYLKHALSLTSIPIDIELLVVNPTPILIPIPMDVKDLTISAKSQDLRAATWVNALVKRLLTNTLLDWEAGYKLYVHDLSR